MKIMSCMRLSKCEPLTNQLPCSLFSCRRPYKVNPRPEATYLRSELLRTKLPYRHTRNFGKPAREIPQPRKWPREGPLPTLDEAGNCCELANHNCLADNQATNDQFAHAFAVNKNSMRPHRRCEADTGIPDSGFPGFPRLIGISLFSS